MIGPFQAVLVALLCLLLISCAATTPTAMTSGRGQALATAPGETVKATVATASTTAAQAARPTGIATTSMRELGIAGEAWASEGNPQAAVTVVEFSDYGCPFCGRYISSTYPLIKKQFIDTGKIFYVYKDFPVVQLHPQAKLAAEAAECAGDQGKYWPMHDLLFANQQSWDTTAAVATDAFAGYAAQLGLERSTFVSCTTGHVHAAEIEQDMAQGDHLGTSGTPTFIINGKQLVGAQQAQAFINAINNELNHTP